jgi:hypothetical protein
VYTRHPVAGLALHHTLVVLLALAILLGLALVAATAQVARAADTEAATVVADQIRRQGFKCEEPVRADRDAKLSAAHEAVWNLYCKDTSYRVRLVPDGAAKVESLQN